MVAAAQNLCLQIAQGLSCLACFEDIHLSLRQKKKKQKLKTLMATELIEHHRFVLSLDDLLVGEILGLF